MMKSWLKKKYSDLTFFQGVAAAICFTSLISIAATNLPGFFIFTAGTPISSSEINTNFEKLAGNIVLQASYTTGFTATNASFFVPSDCGTCNMYKKRMNFNSVTMSDANFKTTNDLETNSSSYGTPFHYYEVPVSGWYELRLIPTMNVTINSSSCDANGCSHNIGMGVHVQVGNNATAAASTSAGMMWLSGTSVNKDERDMNSDMAFDSTSSWPGQPPEIKRYYLQAGQIIFVRAEGNFSQTSVTATYTVGVSAIDFTIIKL